MKDVEVWAEADADPDACFFVLGRSLAENSLSLAAKWNSITTIPLCIRGTVYDGRPRRAHRARRDHYDDQISGMRMRGLAAQGFSRRRSSADNAGDITPYVYVYQVV